MNITRTFFVLAEKEIKCINTTFLNKKTEDTLKLRASAIIELTCEMSEVYNALKNHLILDKTFFNMCNNLEVSNVGDTFLTSVSLLEVKHNE